MQHVLTRRELAAAQQKLRNVAHCTELKFGCHTQAKVVENMEMGFVIFKQYQLRTCMSDIWKFTWLYHFFIQIGRFFSAAAKAKIDHKNKNITTFSKRAWLGLFTRIECAEIPSYHLVQNRDKPPSACRMN